jgi:hypothetical protein
MNGFFPERQYECWVQKIRWRSWQYTLHDSITSVIHRQVNILCSECGAFLVKYSVAVMSFSCSLDEFRCYQIRAIMSDTETLLKFPWECCVRCDELAQVAQFCSSSLGMMRSWVDGGGDHPDLLWSHMLTYLSLHSHNTTNLNKFV